MYLFPFTNKYYNHDFGKIYDTIEEFYPIKRSKRYTSKTISSSPGFKKISEIINKEFMNSKSYNARWGKFASSLKKSLRKPVHSYPYLFGACFSGEVELSTIKTSDFTREKTIVFYISVLGPYFTVRGVDSSTATLPVEHSSGPDTGHFAATHAITVSPVFEYQELFTSVEEKIRETFPGYLFIPYDIGMSTIPNISIADDLHERKITDTIFEALFGQIAVTETLTRGDTHYGFDDWKRSLSTKEEKLMDIIASNIVNSQKDLTIHKVWKLQETKRLETLRISGNLMFGTDFFDILDLTDKAKAIVVSQEHNIPYTYKYVLLNNIIELSANYSFRIAELTNETLTLIMILNFSNKDVSIKGEALEMKFARCEKLKNDDSSQVK